jgi:GxxExxY protein
MSVSAFNHKDTKGTKATKERIDELSNIVIGAAIEVHRVLGPGLLESVYEEALCRELTLQKVSVEREVLVPLEYKGAILGSHLRLDLLIEQALIVEVKAVERFDPVHEAQLLSYLRLTNTWLGLLINLNVPVLKSGVRRLVNGDPPFRSL